ncbi:MAG TPA: response regulator [Gemmatimonadales bacterium]|nr:response regulator [Gemmatimonadales bacterium]
MPPSILLVDDDADVRLLVGGLLTSAGYIVHTAREGHHAFQVLDKIETPDLILLDYIMPMMGGKEFLAIRRRDPRLRIIPVILLSAWTRQWSGARLGVVEVLAKPVDPDRLLTVVERVLRSPVRPAVRAFKFERRRTPRLRLPETARRRLP